jgi:spore coat protein U-like protein
MKKSLVLAMAMAFVMVLSGLAMAAGNAQLNVSASVDGTCKFSAPSTNLAFGAIDPSSLSDATANAAITYKCTKGTPATGVTGGNGVNWDGTNRRLSNGGTDYMKYALEFTNDKQTGTGFGSAQDKTLNIKGTILVTEFQNATAGAYTDTVVLTINP